MSSAISTCRYGRTFWRTRRAWWATGLSLRSSIASEQMFERRVFSSRMVFTATLSATGQLLAASFTTPFQSGTGSYYYPAQDILAMTTDGPSGTGDSDVGPFSLGTFTASAEAVPEPTTIALFATGLLGLYRSRRRRR